MLYSFEAILPFPQHNCFFRLSPILAALPHLMNILYQTTTLGLRLGVHEPSAGGERAPLGRRNRPHSHRGHSGGCRHLHMQVSLFSIV
jgi:hypothetical protein